YGKRHPGTLWVARQFGSEERYLELPGSTSQADRLDLRDALPDGLHVRRLVLHQPGDLGKEIQGIERIRFRAAAHPPHLDRLHSVHYDIVRHELAAHQRPVGNRGRHNQSPAPTLVAARYHY